MMHLINFLNFIKIFMYFIYTIILNYWFIEKYALIYLIVFRWCISFLIIKKFSKYLFMTYCCIIIKEIMILLVKLFC